MTGLIDIGANLTHDSFDRDRLEVIRRAAEAGVDRLIVTGTTLDGSLASLAMSRDYAGQVFATAGIHPHHASEYSGAVAAELKALCLEPEVVAVGECGLDYFRNYSSRQDQLDAFRGQLALAVEVQKPVFLHQRDAQPEFTELLGEFIAELKGGVAHCFTGGKAEMERYLGMGLYIGITGWICDERRNHELQDALTSLPLDRLLLETDAPYLLPRDLTEKPPARRNEPALLPHILATTAKYMQREPEEVAAAATRNTEQLFSI